MQPNEIHLIPQVLVLGVYHLINLVLYFSFAYVTFNIMLHLQGVKLKPAIKRSADKCAWVCSAIMTFYLLRRFF